MSLQTSNIFAALDTKKKKKSSKSSKDTGEKKRKDSKEPDRYACTYAKAGDKASRQ